MPTSRWWSISVGASTASRSRSSWPPGRIDVFGLDGLATLLDDRFRLLTAGRRTALPRHQTLDGHARLELRDPVRRRSRRCLRRLSVFVGIFSLETATAVARRRRDDGGRVIGHLASLVTKSLVVAESSGRLTVLPAARHDPRLCARQARRERRARRRYARRHAEYYRESLRARRSRMGDDAGRRIGSRQYAPCIDNVRAALDWAFSAEGRRRHRRRADRIGRPAVVPAFADRRVPASGGDARWRSLRGPGKRRSHAA